MTREIANWFHEREGELFTESETPFDRDEVVQVLNDSVDPIQQVQVDGDKYIGVISYEEHDGWYEYTRYDDSAGEVNIGVCAKCVKEAETVAEVARTLGDDTNTADEKFKEHYSAEHTESPSEIQTGATLLSGTTINGNEAIHPGMDGSGSGVDADLVRGGEAIEEGVATSGSKTVKGGVLQSFASPSIRAQAVDFDSLGCIWHNDNSTKSVYELDQSGTVFSGFSWSDPGGLAVDDSDCLWLVQASTNGEMFKSDQAGNATAQFSLPGNSASGVGYESSNGCLWHADTEAGADSIYELSQNGNISSKFATTCINPSGVDVDSESCIWYVSTPGVSIYKTNKNGTVQNKLSPPKDDPWGVGNDESGSLWSSDNNGGSIYKLGKSSKVSFN